MKTVSYIFYFKKNENVMLYNLYIFSDVQFLSKKVFKLNTQGKITDWMNLNRFKIY